MADTEDLGKKSLPELLLGYEVVIKFMAGPDINEENRDAVIQDKEILKGAPEARTGTFWLTGTSTTGIEVTREPEGAPVAFLPWGNVLRIHSGLSREKIEEIYREEMASSDAAAEDNPT